MGLYRFWEKLNQFQKFVVAAIAGAAIGYPVTSAMQWLGDHIPFLAFLAVTASYLVGFASDRLVIGLFIGAVIFGLGPLIWASLKTVAPKDLLSLASALATVGGFGYIVFMVGSDIYKGRVNPPVSFAPPVSALHSVDGKKRLFTDKSLEELEAPFKGNTDVVAESLIKPQIGKWIAIRGPLSNLTDLEEYGIQANLTGDGTSHWADLTFDRRWFADLARVKKGERIFAVCTISDANYLSVRLENCELISPP